MKIILIMLMLIDLLLIFRIFKDCWVRYDHFLETRGDIIRTLKSLINHRAIPEKYSYLIYTLKPKILRLIDSGYYKEDDKQELEILYSEIEKIQAKIESTEHEEEIYTSEYFNKIKEIKTKFEEIGKKRLYILDILLVLWILVCFVVFIVLFATIIAFFSM